MLIMIAGPYRSGTGESVVWKRNLEFLNDTAYWVAKKGHTPIVGINAFLPVIEAAGMELYDEYMMKMCLELAERCDAVLRVEGRSMGADKEVRLFESKGLPVYHSLEEIPEESDRSKVAKKQMTG